MEFVNRRAAPFIYSGEKWKARRKSRSEMPVWTVSQGFSHLQWRRLFKELWGRPTTTADFWSSFRQVPYASNLCLLEDKVQDRGMYLFAISYGSDAMDQRSGVGWFSGRIKIFVINKGYFNAKFWSTWCEDCFGTEQHHPWFHFRRKISLEEQKVQKQDRFLRGRQIAVSTLLTWSTHTSGSLEPTILSRTMPTCSLSVYEMMIFRNSIQSGTEFYFQWRKSHLMTSLKDCTN